MDGIPGFAIPIVLSFVEVGEVPKCACISKNWGLLAQEKLNKMKAKAARLRSQVCLCSFMKKYRKETTFICS